MKLKKCNKCDELKPLTEFHKHKKSPDGVRYHCKKCGNLIVAEYQKKYSKKYLLTLKKWRSKNKDRLKKQAQSPERKKYLKKWRQNPEVKKKAAAYQRKQRSKNKEQHALIQRKSALKSLYGVTLEWYDEKLREQGMCCAICGADTPRRKNTKNFSVDHDHSTGITRGLLCTKCNALIGYANESPDILTSAIEYIKKYNI